ncbi:reverse transcriptase [Daphnia sinensis]|uniref:Reverse transcriptase n=1 Tax=Daphnia sinensis TaxID=1820382 RepID=A0AAD5PRC7_9CRUS|nr:reverse transcriptase [Daphnia sinensis]
MSAQDSYNRGPRGRSWEPRPSARGRDREYRERLSVFNQAQVMRDRSPLRRTARQENSEHFYSPPRDSFFHRSYDQREYEPYDRERPNYGLNYHRSEVTWGEQYGMGREERRRDFEREHERQREFHWREELRRQNKCRRVSELQYELDWQQRQQRVQRETDRRDVMDQRGSDSPYRERQNVSCVSPDVSRARSEHAGMDEDLLSDDDHINQERNRPWLPGSTGSRSTESSGEVEFLTASEDAQLPITVPWPISDELTTFMLKPLSGEESKAISKRFPMVFEDPDFGLKPPKLDGYIRRAKDKGALKGVNSTEDVLINTQLKTMDIAPPLVDLLARFSAPGGGETEDIIKVAAEAALRQWGRAFLHVTKLRRQAVVNAVELKSEFILSDPDVFAPGRETQSSCLRTGSCRRCLRKRSKMPPWLNAMHFGVGGRLQFFAGNWKQITDDPWVLETVSEGLKIDFISEPTRGALPLHVAMSKEMGQVCDDEVASLISKRAIVEINDGSEGWVHSFFAVPKKTKGKFRPIINLKPLNRHIQYVHFKMENLETVGFLLRQGDEMVKLDLEDAYLTIPRDRIFEFSCLAFGLAPAPRVFTKLLKVVMAVLRKEGIRLVIYLDDILIMNASRKNLGADIKRIVALVQSLGFCQILEYLGLMVNSKRMSFALPADKVASVRTMCSRALSDNSIPLRKVASILGNFTWAIPSIPFAQSHYRSMQCFYIEQAKRSNFYLLSTCALSREARSDLEWWVKNLSTTQDKLFFPKTPDLEIYSDASLSGWGACCNGVKTRGPWTLADTRKHINELELTGPFYAIQSYAAQSKDVAIRIYLDNTTAVAYINKCGGTRSVALTVAAKALTDWCELRGVAVEAVHLAGELNLVADEESRAQADASDWKMDPLVFAQINRIWPSQVDLFSSPWNAQLPLFVTWRPQPGAMATNTFALNWGGLSGYVFPPFCLIFAHRCFCLPSVDGPALVPAFNGAILRRTATLASEPVIANLGARRIPSAVGVRRAPLSRLESIRRNTRKCGGVSTRVSPAGGGFTERLLQP